MMVGTQKICSLIIEQTTGFSFISIVMFTKKTGTADICIADTDVSFGHVECLLFVLMYKDNIAKAGVGYHSV